MSRCYRASELLQGAAGLFCSGGSHVADVRLAGELFVRSKPLMLTRYGGLSFRCVRSCITSCRKYSSLLMRCQADAYEREWQ